MSEPADAPIQFAHVIGSGAVRDRLMGLQAIADFCQLKSRELGLPLPAVDAFVNINVWWDEKFLYRENRRIYEAGTNTTLFWMYGQAFTIGDLSGYKQPVLNDVRDVVWRKVREAVPFGYSAALGVAIITHNTTVPTVPVAVTKL